MMGICLERHMSLMGHMAFQSITKPIRWKSRMMTLRSSIRSFPSFLPRLISEWIVSVGRHEGFISSHKWRETQNMLDEIAEKYNRPHRKTNALLSGLMYCPICEKRMRVLPESNRWTNSNTLFPGFVKRTCTFKGIEGVTLDEFVIHSLSSLQEKHSDYYRKLLENWVASLIRTDQSEKEYQEIQSNQTRTQARQTTARK